MTLFQSIVEILHDKFSVPITSSPCILVEAKEQNYPESELKMSGLKVLYQYDQDNIEIYPFFSKGFAKKCTDYILFYPYKKKLFIFIIELKSNVYKPAYKQFLASKNFINYVIGVAESNQLISKNNTTANQKVELRCILLSTNKRAGSKPLTNPRKKLSYHKHKEYNLDYTIITPGSPIYVDMICI